MSFRPGQEQPPTPEQLAAFFDGELEGKDALAPLKQRIEAWLCEHPEARAEWDLYRRLAELWRATAPDEPAEEAWNAVRARLPERPAAVKSTRRRLGWIAALLLASAAITFALWPKPDAAPQGLVHNNGDDDLNQPLLVATADEIEILRVEGQDTHTLVVGDHPRGPLELLAPGEASLTSVQPDARDNMVPDVRMQGNSRPMIWARVDSEIDDE